MERNMGDQLNKAFEAYRQACIEKDNAKRALLKQTESHDRHTQKLMQQIEDQKQQISILRAQLSLAMTQAPGELKCCEPALRKQEVEMLLPGETHSDNKPSSSQRKNLFLIEPAEMSPGTASGSSAIEKDVFDTFKKLQGTFQLIQALTRKQQDHLRKMQRGKDLGNEQQFSMPVQCTEATLEQAEGPFSSAIKLEEEELASSLLASRGASPEDGETLDSLIKLSIRFPPCADSEYEFLNSTPEKKLQMVAGWNGLEAAGDTNLAEEPLLETSHCEDVRGPLQPVWSPEQCEAAAVAQAGSSDPQPSQQSNCAFCKTTVPNQDLLSHLNSHFQSHASNGH